MNGTAGRIAANGSDMLATAIPNVNTRRLVIVLLSLGFFASSLRAATGPRKSGRDELPLGTDKQSIQHLSFDLRKNGSKDDFIIFWEKGAAAEFASCGPIGKLHLRKEHRGNGDDFDLGPFKSAKATVLEVPQRNILLIETCGGGAAGGAKYDAFSLMDGNLYRVQLTSGTQGTPLIFAEYTSTGSTFVIRFIEKGLKLKTVTTKGDTRTLTDYIWDGVGYSQTNQSSCDGYDCGLRMAKE